MKRLMALLAVLSLSVAWYLHVYDDNGMQLTVDGPFDTYKLCIDALPQGATGTCLAVYH